MQKIIAVLLSWALLTGAVSPSLAYAQKDAWAQRARVQNTLQRADLQAKQKRVVTVGEIRQAAKNISQPVQDEYQTYKAVYLEVLNEIKQQALFNMPAQAASIQASVKNWQDETKIKNAWNRFKNSPDYQAWQQEAQKQTLAYLNTLSSAAVKYAQNKPAAGAKLIAETLPTFAAVGAVSQANKQAAAKILRTAINAGAKSCGGVGFISGIKARLGRDGDVKEQAKACQGVIEQALALSVLGADSKGKINADAEALSNLLAQGYNGIMGPAVIMSVSRGLLAMNGERALTAELVKISRQLPDIGLFGNDFSFLSVGDWVKFATTLKGDYAIGSEYSFYKGEKANLKNAWIDLGMYLAQAGGKGGKYVLDAVVKDSVWYDSYGNAGVKFKPFVTGALAGGYRIEKGGEVYDALDANGKAYHVDTRAAYGKAKGVMDKLGINESGYFALSLYYSGKDDIDPYTRVYVNNLLVSGYKQTGNSRSFKGFESRVRPSAQEVSGYKTAQTAQKVGQGVDLALVLVFGTKLFVSAVKLGVQGMKTGVRILKLARAGQAANGLGFGKNLSRVIRLGRLQKYGVSSAGQVMLGSVRNVLNPQSVLPKPVVKNLKPAPAAKPATKGTYHTQPGDFAPVKFNKEAAFAKAKATRLNAAKKPLTAAEVQAREMAQARKQAALRTAQEKQARARQIDQDLIAKAEQKARLDAAWKQTDVYKAEQAAANARYARQAAFDAKVDKWTFGTGSHFLKLLRDRAFALNLSLLLNMGSPEALMAARGVAPLKAAAQTEWVQTLARGAQTARTFKWNPAQLTAKPITRAPFYVAEPAKMKPLSFGKWGERSLNTPSWFKLPEAEIYTPIKNILPAAAPAFALQPAGWKFLSPTAKDNTGGYLYGGLPFFSLAKAAQKAATGIKKRFPQGYKASSYTLYSTAFLMGLEVASPIMTDLGMSLGLNMDDNSWVTVATYLPYFLGAMLCTTLHNKMGAKHTLGLGLALNLTGLVGGMLFCGLDGSFTPEVDTQAHFQRILAAIATASLGMILIQSSVGTVLEHLTRVTPKMQALDHQQRLNILEKGNIKMQVFRSVGIIMTYLFPWISAALLHKDWSYAFVIPIPFMALGAGVFLLANLPNIKEGDEAETAPAANIQEQSAAAPAAEAKTKGLWDKIKNSSYISLFKEEPAAKYLVSAAFLMNVIEVTIHNGLMFLLPTMDISDGTRYFLTMMQYAAAFLIGRMIAPWVLKKFPNYKMSLCALVGLGGIALSLPFAQSNAYIFSGALTAAEVGISALFTLLFGAAARNPKTQARMVSLIIASAISCAVGPLWLANIGQWAINTGLLGEKAAMAIALIAIPWVMTIVANILLYRVEKKTKSELDSKPQNPQPEN